MSNLVITGALGHIGSRLIRSLPDNLFEKVILIDNLFTERYSSLFDLPENQKFKFYSWDIVNSDFESLIQKDDVVIHLAAITTPEQSVENSDVVKKINFEGSCHVATSCAKKGARLIFISTTSLYAGKDRQFDEKTSAEYLIAQSPYAQTKLDAERFLADEGARSGLKFTICRFGTIFGASKGMRFHTVVNKFIWQAVLGQPLTVWSSALHQRRPYLDLSDAIRVLIFIIKNNLFDNSVYNAVTINTDVHDITQRIKRVVPDVSIKTVDSKIMNDYSYEVVCPKLLKLGFQFEGDLDRSIRETVTLLKGIHH